ncbi:hypothetical protein [Georgenia sp. H159]|nr:hypothetical protein [Georgenia sp. H159]
MTEIHVAEITDPITGEKTTLTADTESELEQLITAELESAYPLPDQTATE